MSNPIARRLGITKTFGCSTFEHKLLYGYLKALGFHTSEIYIISHINNIYLYLHTASNIKYYVELYKYLSTNTLKNTALKLVIVPKPFLNSSVHLSYMYYSISLRASVKFNYKFKRMLKNYKFNRKLNLKNRKYRKNYRAVRR